MTRIIFISFFLFSALKSYEQKKDSVYESPDVPAHWNFNEENSRLLFKVIGVLAKSECRDEKHPLLTSLRIIFTITKDGKVLDAEFPALEATATCKELLRKELLVLKGWKAGKVNGQTVISKAAHFIPCIYWEGQ